MSFQFPATRLPSISETTSQVLSKSDSSLSLGESGHQLPSALPNNLAGRKLKTFYPNNQFNILEIVCFKIIKALEKKRWAVPGISVDFLELNTKNNTFKFVKSISAQNFDITFYRLEYVENSRKLNRVALEKLTINANTIAFDSSTYEYSYNNCNLVPIDSYDENATTKRVFDQFHKWSSQFLREIEKID